MKKIKYWLERFFTNPKCVISLGLIITIVATTLEVIRFRARNFYDFHDATIMFWSGITPYCTEYVDTYTLYFLYTPVFTTIFTPFFLLPEWLGAYVWNIFNYSMFTSAIWKLPNALSPYKNKIFLFLLSILLQSIFCFQYNTVVCYIFLFAFILLERNKPIWAVLLIMISATTKIYGIAELALLFCYPKVWRNLGYAVLFGIGLLLLPAINPAVDNIATIYKELADILSTHHNEVDFPGLLFARGLHDILLPNYRIVQLTVLALLGILFFWRHQRWSDFRFRAQALAAIMGYIILFSDSPETHTYIIALSGYLIAFWLQTKHTWFDWTIFWLLFVNFCILPTDVLCPAWLHKYIHQTFWLDIYSMTIAWLLIIWRAVGPSFERFTPIAKRAATICILILCATATKAQDKTFQVNGVKFIMKAVKGGSFTMGAVNKQDADADELPTHQVYVKDFFLGETEVTQELWTAVMEKNPSKIRGDKGYPVERISYDDCLQFIEQLNQLTKQHFRLPTEEEWEYAARGGQQSKGTIYAGSNNPDNVADYRKGRSKYEHLPVKSKMPNELGLYDMSGSVWEWCNNDYDEYTHHRTNFITKMFRQRFKVIRGGSFNNTAKDARVSNRYMFIKERRKPTVGMRLAL